MVGSPDNPDDAGAAGEGVPRAKSFLCPACGASVTLRLPGQSLSAVCQNCLSVIDTQDENYAILEKFFSSTKRFKPLIPFGSRAKLQGRVWECIGFAVRQDEASRYTWEEYLLFNPYYGYRWLTLNGGHWSLVTTIKRKPETNQFFAELESRRYRLFYRGNASYIYVLGEFYWKVRAGERVSMEDYISPPYMLSCERNDKELIWSISEYLEAKLVTEAFKIDPHARSAHLEPIAMAPNQPSRATAIWHSLRKCWLLFALVLTGLQVIHVSSSSSAVAFQEGLTFPANMKVSDFSTKTFTLKKESANLQISVFAPVNNSWFYMEGDLVDDKTGDTYPISASVEAYSGYSDGEYWSEGSTIASLRISKVPAGDYYINMDFESGQFPVTGEQKGFTLTVLRDVPNWSNYLWSLFFLSILPVWYWIRSCRDELERWSHSDFSPYQSDGSIE